MTGRAAAVRVVEIFGPTVQGEGAFIGRPTVFVRTGGCDYRCAWCDSLYAVLPEHRAAWRPMSPGAIVSEVNRLSGGVPILVTLSGGNPALQPLGDVLAAGRIHGHTFTLETQGSAARSWMADLDGLCVSPKPPSSGMPTDMDALAQCVGLGVGGRAGAVGTSLKVVVFDETDYQYARTVAAAFPEVAMYLQAGNGAPHEAAPSDTLATLRWLVSRVVQDRWYSVRALPQLHVLLWGNARGV